MLAFTEVLSSDLKGTGVTATALCPGPVKTEFMDQHAGFDAASRRPDFIWMSAEDCARAAIKGLERGKRVVVPGRRRTGSARSPGSTRRAACCFAAARRFYPLGK